MKWIKIPLLVGSALLAGCDHAEEPLSRTRWKELAAEHCCPPRNEESRAAQEDLKKWGAYFRLPKESGNAILLTFDCGFAEPYHVEAILDILREKQVSAIFFGVSPFFRHNGDLVRRMIREGHQLGNHTVKHLDVTHLSRSECIREIRQVQALVKKRYGYDIEFFRYPYGLCSERTLALVQSLGLKTIFWTCAHRDWEMKNQPDPKESLEFLLARAFPGCIYLLHTHSDSNLALLPALIDRLREQGYHFACFHK